MLEELATQGPERPAPKLVPPSLVAALPAVNTGIALAVVFDMVTKPAAALAPSRARCSIVERTSTWY